MKRRWYFLILTVLLLLCCAPLSVSAAEIEIYDEAQKLTASERTECLAALQDAADHTNMNIGIVIGGKHRSEGAVEALAQTYYTEKFRKRTDGVLYYMDLSGSDPYDYICTSGMGQFYITDGSMENRVEEIFDALDLYMYPAGSEDVPAAIQAFAEQVKYYYDCGVPEGYWLYDDQDGCYYQVEDGEIVEKHTRPLSTEKAALFGVIGLGIGLVIAIIVFISVKIRYRFKAALSPTHYVNKKNVVYHEQYDRFVRTYTTKTKIESDSGSSSGGGGSSSGGFGGGGHHR